MCGPSSRPAMCRSRSTSTSGVKSSGCDGTAHSQNLVRDAVGIKCCSQKASCKPAIAVRCATGRCFRECSNEHVAQSMHGVVRDRSSQRAFLCVKMMMMMVVVLVVLVMMILTRALLLIPKASLVSCRGPLYQLPSCRPDSEHFWQQLHVSSYYSPQPNV